jgi:hypothetical protein
MWGKKHWGRMGERVGEKKRKKRKKGMNFVYERKIKKVKMCNLIFRWKGRESNKTQNVDNIFWGRHLVQ